VGEKKGSDVTVYDVSESIRQTNAWVGATTKAFWQNPAFSLTMSPLPSLFAAWGEVTERAFEKVATKPMWGIENVVSKDNDYPVKKKIDLELPFCDLIHFAAERNRPVTRKVLLVAPMSGHYATLCRKTVISLLPNCDVYVTEWKNARDVPLSAGKFDVENYIKYVVQFMMHLGKDVHVMAVCQPVPLTLVATAMLAEDDSVPNPRTLTLIGGPVDPDANPTEVTDFGNRITMGQLEHTVITSVGFAFPGVGRKVYPGAMQLASFVAMNASTHAQAFINQIGAVARGEAADLDRHNKFYDEYLAVMDMPAEFYLSTVERVFKTREVARNAFTVDGEHIDISKITETAVIIVEGGRDDISAPGQCLAALDLLPNLPDSMKDHLIAKDAGHYGIFSGSAWRNDIRPVVLKFIDAHNGVRTKVAKVTKLQPKKS
jgi:poly(3-hydroxybutyrate) depolymerase